MRKIIVLSMITLDGVIQAPGGPKEDVSGGFKYGGWVAPLSDDVSGKATMEELNQPADFILGRKTFTIWANYWPSHNDFWPAVNAGNKYVFSKTLKKDNRMVTGWQHSVVIKTVADIKKLKQGKGRDIQVWGSAQLVQLLLKNDLVDELRLKIYPVILGKGKKLFSNNAAPAAFTLTDSTVSSTGIILANYKRAGKVKTGAVGA